jgi:hypothetical protein
MRKKQPKVVATTTDKTIDRVSFTHVAGVRHLRPADSALFDAGIIAGRPVRKPGRWRGQMTYPGKHWFASSGLHISFESMLERSALMRIDFALDVVAIAAQPMRIHFADGGTTVPDFLAEYRNGEQTVFEVKPSHALTEERLARFAESKRVCATVGWGFEILTEASVIVMDNLELLAAYRHPLYMPTPEAQARILTAARNPLPLREGAIVSGLPIRRGYAAVYHLAWKRQLDLDLTTPITNRTAIAA